MGDKSGSLGFFELSVEFWSDRRVFLTGHTGFKGSWMSLMLQTLGAKVTGYSLKPSTNPSLFEVADIASNMVSIYADILDFDTLKLSLIEAKPEIVIHMAAQPLVRLSYEQPIQTYATNVMGTANLLEILRDIPSVKVIVVVTTDKCYENRGWAWGYRESDALGGYDPYSSSKACAELVCSAYRSSYFKSKKVRLATARAGNVIGGGDWSKDRLLPDLIRSFECNKDALIRNPKSVRPWQHVFEPLRGYLMLAQRLHDAKDEAFSRAWNFGPSYEDCRQVEWVASKMCELWGEDASWRSVLDAKLHEASTLKLDTSLANVELGWKPVLNLEQGLILLVEWTKGYLESKNAYDFSMLQIQNYIRVSFF